LIIKFLEINIKSDKYFSEKAPRNLVVRREKDCGLIIGMSEATRLEIAVLLRISTLNNRQALQDTLLLVVQTKSSSSLYTNAHKHCAQTG